MNKLEAIKRRRVMEGSISYSPPGVFLEWIESTGEQYIDTGINERLDVKVEINTEISFNTVNSENLQAEGNFYGVYYGVVQSKFTLGGGIVINSPILANKKYLVEFTRVGYDNTLVIDKTDSISRNYSNTVGKHICLFDLAEDISGNYKFRQRKYWAEIKTPNTHLNLRPFLHQDGRIGMWDTVGHKFYPNMGTGEFNAGPIVDDDFWELEWIESTGEQYMDLEYFSDFGEDTIEIKFSLRDPNHTGLVYSTMYDVGSVPCEIVANEAEGGSVIMVLAPNDLAPVMLGIPNDSTARVFKRAANTFYLDGESLEEPLSEEYYFTPPASSVLFGLPTGEYMGMYRVYYADIDYARGAFARRLIPVQKKISGEVCMYDLVSKRFFYNKGTGEFIAGPIKNVGFILTGTLTNDTLFSEILQTETEVKAWIAERQTTLKTIKIDDSAIENTRKFKDCSHLFDGCHNLTDIDVVNLDVSEVTNMSFMFKECSKLLHLNIAGWDTSNVTDLTCVFYECKKLVSLDLSTWNTSKVSSVAGAFGECHSLKSLNVATWDTSKVTAMSYAFGFCESLESLDLSKWVATNVSDMSLMFDYCITLTTIDLSSMIIHESINLDEAFRDMRSITTAYGKDIESCALLNDSASKAENVNFIVKQSIFRTSDNEIFKTNDNKILRV